MALQIHPHLERHYIDLLPLVDKMNCGFAIRDLEGCVCFANERLCQWLGYEKREIEGMHLEKLMPPEVHDIIREEIQSVESGDVRIRLVVLQRKDSTTFPVLGVPNRILDSKGRFLGGFMVFVDLAAVQTAKPAGYGASSGLRATIDRIALELQALGLSAAAASPVLVPLQHPELKALSPREKEVLAYLLGGERVPAIAKRLFISQYTVRNHLKSMYRKLGVQNQSELIQRVRSLVE